MLIPVSTSRIQQNINKNAAENLASRIENFFPREHAILAGYFDLQEKLPEEARAYDPKEIIEKDSGYDEETEGIGCRKSYGGRDYHEVKSSFMFCTLLSSEVPETKSGPGSFCTGV
jgi:hypothetical protein